ncbi:Protein tyrosine kinase [Seminavis robusta]|uniref:Protein tyrosine kinase n=1 Tax=Seminavis robusta TaxID=568900 RepID=A0A9N8HG18_9STRA|nr:Protein tyrosine kinase [Seminavis robusta]|eukprot:Sro606_g174460.1 Protein tyrosine kinase (1140) ;mRNA; f:14903-18429
MTSTASIGRQRSSMSLPRPSLKNDSSEEKHLVLSHFRRRPEEMTILHALAMARETRTVQVVMVGGSSGVGKTTTVTMALQNSINSAQDCWRGTAKFERRKSPLPFAPLRQLLSSLCQVMQASELREECRQILLKTLSSSHIHILSGLATTHLQALLDEDDDGPDDISQCSTGTLSTISSQQSNQSLVVEESFGTDDDEKESSDTSNTTAIVKTPTFGSTSSASSLHTKDIDGNTLHELKMAVRAFLQAITTLRPAILCMDDIMWSDDATLQVLQGLLQVETTKGILACITHHNDVDHESKHWSTWKTTLQGSDAVHSMVLRNLTLSEVTALLADSMGMDVTTNTKPPHRVEDLAELCYGYTRGNLFFLAQVIENLQETQLLQYDRLKMHWRYDTDEIKKGQTSLSNNVLQVVSSRLELLPEHARQTLQLASCFGSRVTKEVLEVCQSVLSSDDTTTKTESLQLLCSTEFLTCLASTEQRFYQFSHDSIELAAFSLLPSQDGQAMAQLHWKIAALLMGHLPRAPKDDWLFFACVDQLNLSAGLAQTLEERIQIATLNLKAGARAAAMSAFLPASNYLRAGIIALGPDPFTVEDTYDFAILLHSLYSKTLYCVGNIVESRDMAELVVSSAKTEPEKEAPSFTLIKCYFAEDEGDKLVDLCFEQLKRLGIQLPNNPGTWQVQMEQRRLYQTIRKYPDDEKLLALSRMNDDTKALALRILCELVFTLHHQGRTALLGLVTSQMFQITAKYGYCRYTPEVFAVVGAYLSSRGQIKEGLRFAALAEKLLEYPYYSRNQEIKGRAYVYIAAFTKWWVLPIPKSLDLLIAGNENCMASGCIPYACHSQILYSTNFFYSGLPTESLLHNVENFCTLMLEYKQERAFLVLTPLWQCLLNLAGQSLDPLDMKAGYAHEQRQVVLDKASGDASACYINCYGMQLAYYLGDLDKAIEYSKQLKENFNGLSKACVNYVTQLFFFALIALARYRKDKKRVFRDEAQKYIKVVHGLVKGGGMNILHKFQLLEAELAAVLPNTSVEDGCKKYSEAIVSAQQAGFLQDAALANYLCFWFRKSRSDEDEESCGHHLEQAYTLWRTWNAHAVADSLADRHPDDFASILASEPIPKPCIPAKSEGFPSMLADQHRPLPIL